MQSNPEFAPRYPTYAEIRRGVAQGRRERAIAVSAMFKALFDFLVGRKVKTISGVCAVAEQTG